MNIISPKQCRAARALLDITRADLSQISTVSTAATGGFETEATAPRAASVSLIRAALEGKGVEFLDNDGVRERKNTVRVYQGEKIHRQLLDEIYSDLKTKVVKYSFAASLSGNGRMETTSHFSKTTLNV